MEKNKLLILGGTSSFASEIIECAKKNHYVIYSSVRKKDLKIFSKVSNLIQLNLENLDSIEYFLGDIKKYNFSHIICLIGSLSRNSSNSLYADSKKYVDTYITNLLYLFDKLLADNNLRNKSKILIMSSRSARYGSHDYLYSVSKAAVEAYVKSKSKLVKGIQINCVSTGLVQDSKMFKTMPIEIVNSHKHRSRNKLLNVPEIASILISLFDNKEIVSGDTIYIGPQYE
jgi:NADP-dependent 3-hydroxy acid dehydrogenase YdfG